MRFVFATSLTNKSAARVLKKAEVGLRLVSYFEAGKTSKKQLRVYVYEGEVKLKKKSKKGVKRNEI